MKEDKLSQIFDIPSEKTEIITKQGEVIPYQEKTVAKIEDKQVDDDFEKIRNNLKEIMQQGSDALYHALEVAKNSEHPRAFEVVSNMMKQLSDINLQLLDAHKKHKDISKKEEEEKPQAGQNVTNNAIFVGSTHELAKMIEGMKKDK
jgi:hypothetical protein